MRSPRQVDQQSIVEFVRQSHPHGGSAPIVAKVSDVNSTDSWLTTNLKLCWMNIDIDILRCDLHGQVNKRVVVLWQILSIPTHGDS